MAQDTKIEWADHTFNPWIGCSKVSPGCANCYAEEMMDHRYGKVKWGPSGTRVVTSDTYWKQPLKWNKQALVEGVRRRVFCASLADVFEDRQDLVETRHRLIDLIYKTPGLDWLLLTKRPEIAYWWSQKWPFHKNIWIGTSVENQSTANERIQWLLKIEATKRFLSMEPLLGMVNIAAAGALCTQEQFGQPWNECLHWVIVGGESGSNARPMHPLWVRDLRNQCIMMKIPFFFKQWGEYGPDQVKRTAFTPVYSGVAMDHPASMYRVGKKQAGRLLDGREWNEVPDGLFAKETVSHGPASGRGDAGREQGPATAPAGNDEQVGGGILEPSGGTADGRRDP